MPDPVQRPGGSRPLQGSAPLGRALQGRPTAPLDGRAIPGRDSLSTTGRLSESRSLAEAVAAARAANPRATFGNDVVQGARALIEGGYKYPPNLTTRYYHSPGRVGCCADFVADSYHRAGFALGKDMQAKGYNPHYCPSMIQYFRKEQQLVDRGSPAHVGDVVFFDWDKDGKSDHVGVVSKVDAQGRPTEMLESNKFGQPAHRTVMNQGRLDSIMAYGRLTGAGADDGAAADLPPVQNPLGGGSSLAAVGREDGPVPYRPSRGRSGGVADVPAAGPPSDPPAARSFADLLALREVIRLLARVHGIEEEQAAELLGAARQGKDPVAAGRRMGLDDARLDRLAKDLPDALSRATEAIGNDRLPLPGDDDAWGFDRDEATTMLEPHRDVLETVAKEHGIDAAELAAAAWMDQDGLAAAIAEGRTADRLTEAAKALAGAREGEGTGERVLKAVDPEGRLAPDERKDLLQLYSNRLAAARAWIRS
ncbi:MAG: CHAP domain-containing protein [Candidatus Sericytochromatia bacterium]|nr:CHAP domain-containing protein [Candidatus Sericytochromatia bacterium]